MQKKFTSFNSQFLIQIGPLKVSAVKIAVEIRCLTVLTSKKTFKNITSTNMFVRLASLAHQVGKIL